MSSLQVDSIAAIGGGHVDGTGLVVQYKQAVNTTATTVSSTTLATIATIQFTPKFSDSLILVQAFHSNDACTSTNNNNCSSYLSVGTTEVGRTEGVGYLITKASDGRFQYAFSGSIASWGTTSLEVKLAVEAQSGNWIVSKGGRKTSLLVWEIAQ